MMSGKVGTETEIKSADGNLSLSSSLNYADLADRSVMLKLGRTDDGGYAVIIGGIINSEGTMESHGRWLPYPILVPMMVGTAMSIEKDYYSADTAFEIGRLSQKALQGDHQSKEKIRSFYWSAHQLARKMNLIQMAELTQSSPNLQGNFRFIRPDPDAEPPLIRLDWENQSGQAGNGLEAYG